MIKLRNINQVIDTKGRVLPLQKTSLRANARGGVASVLLTQTFENPYDEALSVTYLLPLPADAAISGFAFIIGEQRATGEVNTRAKARAKYQAAREEGKSASLMEQARSSVFTQEIANIPSRAQVVVEVLLDQRLIWAHGSWEWRFPTTVAPRYTASNTARPLEQSAQWPSLSFSLFIQERLEGKPSSPSHEIITKPGALDTVVQTQDDSRRDRDIVVRWPVATTEVQTSLSTCRPEIGGLDHMAFGLLTLLPPKIKSAVVSRDLILLLDISGSMEGAPLAQEKELCAALIQSLEAHDQIELYAFSDNVRCWRKTPSPATDELKADAIRWLHTLKADGGTEMRDAIIRALSPLRSDAQRQVILMTDGLINFEDEITQEVFHRVPRGSRVHCVGVGSSVNRTLTASVARAGAGVEQIIGLNESAAEATKKLLARTESPLVVNLQLSGSALLDFTPSRLPDLYAGSPALLSIKLKPAGGELFIEGDTPDGRFRQALSVESLEPRDGEQSIAALYAREAAEDLEMEIAAGRPRRERNQQITELGLSFQIATRLTSWIAVNEEITGRATREENIPQELTSGLSSSYGFQPIRAFERRRAAREDRTESAISKLRNITILGQIDAGKTTLLERMLYFARPESETQIDYMMDYMEIERERGISYTSPVSSCDWDDYTISTVHWSGHREPIENVLDTVEGALFVIDNTTGTRPYAARQVKDLACVTLINKLDKQPFEILSFEGEINDWLGRAPLYLQLPIFEAETFVGVIDLLMQEAHLFIEHGIKTIEAPIPEHMVEDASRARQRLIEAIANLDEGVADEFLAERTPTTAQLNAVLRRLCIERKATPVLLCSAFKSRGISPVLDAVRDYLPAPQEVTREALTQNNKKFEFDETSKQFVARVFRQEHTYWRDHFSYLRVYQGTLSNGDMLFNCTTSKSRRVNKILRAGAWAKEEIEEASAGEIVALSKFECSVGDMLTLDTFHCEMPSKIAPAIIAATLLYEDKAMQDRLLEALPKVKREEPSLLIREDLAQKQITIVAQSELHLEVIIERLRREFRCRVEPSQPTIERREQGGVILEPIVSIELWAKEERQMELIKELMMRHAVLTKTTFSYGYVNIVAEAPLRLMIGYRSRCDCEVKFLRYEAQGN